MRPLASTFPYFILFAAVFVWAFVPEARVVRRARKESAAGAAPQDKRSLQVVMLTQALGFAAAFWLAWMPFGRVHDQHVIFWIGMTTWVAGAWLGALIACTLAVVGYAYRVQVEERALTETLGSAYREYASRTKRFVPFLV